MGYHKQIDGKKYDGALLELAEKLTKANGDGRISEADAKELIKLVVDGGEYTDVEKDTVEYMRKNFKWTDAADEWFRTEIRRFAATKGVKD